MVHQLKRHFASGSVLALYASVFFVLTLWSWRTWPDPLVDFGRELYVPWALTRGRVLYRDIASLFGPLSPYVNALWFRMFGVSLLTLAVCNLVIFAALIAGIHRLIRIATNRVTAAATGLTCLVLFGFSQYVATGNYNFVSPYSHEATHGLALSVAMMVLLHDALAARRRISSAAAGVCFGLALLTKPEIVVAAVVAVLASWSMAGALGGDDRWNLASAVPIFVGSAAIAPLCFFGYFARQMEAGAALRATAGAWAHVGDNGITANEFYRRVMGLDAPLRHAARMLVAFAGFLAFVGAAAAISWRSADEERPSERTRLLRLGLLGAAIFIFATPDQFPRVLPPVAATTLAAAVVMFLRARDRDRAVGLAPLVMWSAFALVLLAKLGLHPRIEHYGFYLALPATATAVALLSGVIPEWLAERKSEAVGRRFRTLALLVLAVPIVPYVGLAHGWQRTKTLAIGSGNDRFYATATGPMCYGRGVHEALSVLGHVAAPGDTLAVLPEGIMINYLQRLDSPLRVINLMPPELIAFGEDDVLRSLAANPPTFVLLVDRDTREYGYPPFGTDVRYGLRIWRWIDDRYDTIRTIRQGPDGSAVGMDLLRKRAR